MSNYGIMNNTAKLLGTDIVLNEGDEVEWIPASNQPDYVRKQLIFAWVVEGRSILLTMNDLE